MPDKIVNHFVLADGSVARYDYGSLENQPLPELVKAYPDGVGFWERKQTNNYSHLTIDSTNRIRTAQPIDKTVSYIEAATGYQFALFAYIGLAFCGAYINGAFTPNAEVSWLTAVDVSNIRNSYPGVDIYVVGRKANNSTFSTGFDNFYFSYLGVKDERTLVEKMASPDCWSLGTLDRSNAPHYRAASTTKIFYTGGGTLKKGTLFYSLVGQYQVVTYGDDYGDGVPMPEVDYGLRQMANGSWEATEDSNSYFIVLAYKDNREITSDNLQELLDGFIVENDVYKWVQEFGVNANNINGVNYTVSSMTFVKDKLLVFPYASNDDHTVTYTGRKYQWYPDGTISRINNGAGDNPFFTFNIGHANTVDYSDGNNCLIAGNGGGSGNTEPNEFYIFPNADTLTAFDVNAETTLRYDVSSLDWGKQLNIVWGESGRNDYNIIYAFTNYEQGNMDAYGQNNPNNFTGASKRFIRRIILGKGENQYENGTFISGKAANEFNGTFKVTHLWEREFVYAEANNDSCYYNGCLYEMLVKDDAYGIPFTKHSFEDFGATLTTKKKVIFVNYQNGNAYAGEGEGLAIRDGVLYTARGMDIMRFYKVDL